MSRIFSSLVLGASLLIPVIALPAQTPDLSRSSISATFKQMGVPVEAPFRKFSANIDFDPAKPGDGKASIEIDVASLDLGDPEYNGEIGKAEWFDAAHFPKATFSSTAIKPVATGQIEVTGQLSIKGKTSTIVIPVAYQQGPGGTTFQGSVPVKRLAFNIGQGEWKDTSTLADEVLVKFRVVVPPKK